MRGITGLMITICVSIFLFPAGKGVAVEPIAPEEPFFRANQAYKEGRFQAAVSGYRQVIEAGHKNGHLYYNLANAYFREKDLGRAILFYERARQFMPRDGDLNFNLRYALDQTKDAIGETQGFLKQTFFWLNGLTLEELLTVFVVLNALFWGSLVLRLFARAEWTYYALLLLLVFWLIGGLSTGVKWYQVGTDDRCVILQEEVAVHAGPDAGDTVLFKLHQGVIVQAERSEDGWTLIRLPDKKRGWLENAAVEWILPRNG